MKSLAAWLQEYGESHQNRQNQRIHKLCVPLIFFTVVGFLHFYVFPTSKGFSIGDLLVALALLWYLILHWKAFFLMGLELAVSYALLFLLAYYANPLPILLLIFVLAWVGQFIGHEIEGKRPSFLKDLQFLLIGPLWVFQGFFR